MIEIKRTDSADPDFQKLVRQLDAYLADVNGEEAAFYAQFNRIDAIRNVMLAFENEKVVGCGAFKKYDESTVEIKRMFVRSEKRGAGVASKILEQLEEWARELAFRRCILETSVKMKDAIALYQKNGYARVENFGQYADNSDSICFEKWL